MKNDVELKQIIEGTSNFSISPQRLPVPLSSKQLYCHVNGTIARPFIPEPSRKSVFEAIHCISHPGIRATNN